RAPLGGCGDGRVPRRGGRGAGAPGPGRDRLPHHRGEPHPVPPDPRGGRRRRSVHRLDQPVPRLPGRAAGALARFRGRGRGRADHLLLRPQRHAQGVPRGALVPQAVVRALVPAVAGPRGPAGPRGGAQQLSVAAARTPLGATRAQRRSSRRRTAAGISTAASAALTRPPGRTGHRPAASAAPRPISAPITAFMIIARYGTPTRKGTALAATKPARASIGRRSQARSANQPATNAAGTKPRMNPKLGDSTEAGPPLNSANTGAPATPTSR